MGLWCFPCFTHRWLNLKATSRIRTASGRVVPRPLYMGDAAEIWTLGSCLGGRGESM